MSKSKFLLVEEYCRTSYFFNKSYNKLKNNGLGHLAVLCEVCPSEHEQDFNKWIFGEGMQYRIEDQSQMMIVHELFISYLNTTYRQKQGENNELQAD